MDIRHFGIFKSNKKTHLFFHPSNQLQNHRNHLAQKKEMSRLIPRQPSLYAKHMQRLSERIFSEPPAEAEPKTLNVVRTMARKPEEKEPIKSRHAYPPAPMFHHLFKLLRNMGLYRDEHLDFNEEIRRLRALRGKIVPAPGEGKRALQRKGL